MSVSAGDMVRALREVAGDEVANRVSWQPDDKVERIVGSWPGRWDTARANQLGLRGDEDFAAIVRAYIADDLTPAKP